MDIEGASPDSAPLIVRFSELCSLCATYEGFVRQLPIEERTDNRLDDALERAQEACTPSDSDAAMAYKLWLWEFCKYSPIHMVIHRRPPNRIELFPKSWVPCQSDPTRYTATVYTGSLDAEHYREWPLGFIFPGESFAISIELQDTPGATSLSVAERREAAGLPAEQTEPVAIFHPWLHCSDGHVAGGATERRSDNPYRAACPVVKPTPRLTRYPCAFDLALSKMATGGDGLLVPYLCAPERELIRNRPIGNRHVEHILEIGAAWDSAKDAIVNAPQTKRIVQDGAPLIAETTPLMHCLPDDNVRFFKSTTVGDEPRDPVATMHVAFLCDKPKKPWMGAVSRCVGATLVAHRDTLNLMYNVSYF